jgi:hypothetical protein
MNAMTLAIRSHRTAVIEFLEPYFRDSIAPPPGVSHRAPDHECIAMLEQACHAALDLLGVSFHQSADSISVAIQEYLDKPGQRPRSPTMSKQDTALALGALWGELICRAAGWSWLMLKLDGDECIAIGDQLQAHVALPLHYLQQHLGVQQSPLARLRETVRRLTPWRNSDELLAPNLLFQCIVQANLPPSMPRQYFILTTPGLVSRIVP